MLTTKRLPLKAIVHELLWFLASGNTNIEYCQGQWRFGLVVRTNGNMGPVYRIAVNRGRRRTGAASTRFPMSWT